MTQPLPFADGSFDLIFHPVSNCYIREVRPLWRECARVLAPGGVLMAGLDNGINYLFDDAEQTLTHRLPFDPLADEQLYRECMAAPVAPSEVIGKAMLLGSRKPNSAVISGASSWPSLGSSATPS